MFTLVSTTSTSHFMRHSHTIGVSNKKPRKNMILSNVLFGIPGRGRFNCDEISRCQGTNGDQWIQVLGMR